jgi:DnaJ family protein A protein 5
MNYYQILELEQAATLEQIKKSYRKLALQYHPDKNRSKSTEEQTLAAKKFLAIQDAYDTLNDSVKKNAYDESLKKSTAYHKDISPVSDLGRASSETSASEQQANTASNEDYSSYAETHYNENKESYSEQASYAEQEANYSTDFDDAYQETEYEQNVARENNNYSSFSSSPFMFFNVANNNAFDHQQLFAMLIIISLLNELMNTQSAVMFMRVAPIVMFASIDLEEEYSHSSRFRF